MGEGTESSVGQDGGAFRVFSAGSLRAYITVLPPGWRLKGSRAQAFAGYALLRLPLNFPSLRAQE